MENTYLNKTDYTAEEWEKIMILERIEQAKYDSFNVGAISVEFEKDKYGNVVVDKKGNRNPIGVTIQSGR